MSDVNPPATPMAFVQAILLAYRRYGRDPGPALAQARIDPGGHDDDTAGVTAHQLEAFGTAAMRELDDEALGWWTRRLPWGTYGMLARASLTAPDLGVALKRWIRHHRLVCEDVTLTLDVRPGAPATLSLREDRPAWSGTRELCLVTTLRNVHGYASWLVDSRVALRHAAFPFAAPPHAQAYPHMFGCPIEFDAPAASLCFDADYLALPIRRDERAARQMLQRALPLTVHLYRRDRLLRQRVQALLDHAAPMAANAEAIAAALHISTRTLHRRLREEGVSLQSMRDESRQSKAVELLTRSPAPLKQIAGTLGYSSVRCFTRAFQQWTGQSPTAFRRHRRTP